MSTPSRTIGNYVLGPLIGRGGTGEVYAAEAVDGGAPVAIKLLRSHVASDPAAIAAFRAEAERTRAIAHRNVVRVIDFACDRDGFYLVMDRLDGETLAARLARGPVPEATARRLGAAIADGLAAAHDRGIVHRDLKPGNIVLVAPADEPCIVDFGIARYFAGDAPATTTSRIGTPAYMAPEQLTGGVIAPCVDVWALGAVLYELVTGTVPFHTGDGACPQLFETAPRLREVSAGYAAVVAACLEREPGRRPPGVREVARALREVDGERITEDVGAMAQQRSPETRSRDTRPLEAAPVRRRAAITIGATCALAVAGIATWRLGGGSGRSSPDAVAAPNPAIAAAPAPDAASAPSTPSAVVAAADAPATAAAASITAAAAADRPAAATLDVRSSPAAAAIRIAGKRVGVTPATITTTVPATLVVSHPGYRPATVRADRAGLVDVQLVPLARARAHAPARAAEPATRRAGETLD